MTITTPGASSSRREGLLKKHDEANQRIARVHTRVPRTYVRTHTGGVCARCAFGKQVLSVSSGQDFAFSTGLIGNSIYAKTEPRQGEISAVQIAEKTSSVRSLADNCSCVDIALVLLATWFRNKNTQDRRVDCLGLCLRVICLSLLNIVCVTIKKIRFNGTNRRNARENDGLVFDGALPQFSGGTFRIVFFLRAPRNTL